MYVRALRNQPCSVRALAETNFFRTADWQKSQKNLRTMRASRQLTESQQRPACVTMGQGTDNALPAPPYTDCKPPRSHRPLMNGLLRPAVAQVFEDGGDVVDDELVDAAARDPAQHIAQRCQAVPLQHL